MQSVARDVHIATGVFIQVPLAIGVLLLCSEWNKDSFLEGDDDGAGAAKPMLVPGWLCVGIGLAANAVFFTK